MAIISEIPEPLCRLRQTPITARPLLPGRQNGPQGQHHSLHLHSWNFTDAISIWPKFAWKTKRHWGLPRSFGPAASKAMTIPVVLVEWGSWIELEVFEWGKPWLFDLTVSCWDPGPVVMAWYRWARRGRNYTAEDPITRAQMNRPPTPCQPLSPWTNTRPLDFLDSWDVFPWPSAGLHNAGCPAVPHQASAPNNVHPGDMLSDICGLCVFVELVGHLNLGFWVLDTDRTIARGRIGVFYWHWFRGRGGCTCRIQTTADTSFSHWLLDGSK